MFACRFGQSRVGTGATEKMSTDVFDPLHDFHLVFDFLVQDAVSHELCLVQLFCGVWQAVKLGSHFVDCCKGTPSNLAHAIILVRSVP